MFDIKHYQYVIKLALTDLVIHFSQWGWSQNFECVWEILKHCTTQNATLHFGHIKLSYYSFFSQNTQYLLCVPFSSQYRTYLGSSQLVVGIPFGVFWFSSTLTPSSYRSLTKLSIKSLWDPWRWLGATDHIWHSILHLLLSTV